MSEHNPLWGAPRIHGELVKLGIDVVRRRSQSTLRADASAVADMAHVSNQYVHQIVAADFFVVPTATTDSCSCW